MTETTDLLPPLRRVAIIGAGTLGLAALAQLLEEDPENASKVVCFEARSDVGGLWRYEEDPGECRITFTPSGQPIARNAMELDVPPSAAYPGLRANLPTDVMSFRGHAYPSDADLFPTHDAVLDYLVSYADEKNLRPLIQFSTLVTRIHKVADYLTSGSRWSIWTERDGAALEVKRFSHVIVCNGHYSVPWIPRISGLWDFNGEILHSRWWRSADRFKGKKVLVVGSRASGGDIARELALVNLDPQTSPSDRITLYQSSRSALYPLPQEPWEAEILVRPSISSISRPSSSASSASVAFTDLTSLDDVDAIIFATGYDFAFPFLRPELGDLPWSSTPVTVPRRPQPGEEAPPGETTVPEEKIETRLLKSGGSQVECLDPGADLFYLPDPTICFPGLAYMVAPARFGETQARLAARVYSSLQRVPRLPPLKHSQTSELNHHVVGFPAEAENADTWLQAIGEGRRDGPGWTQTSDAWLESRRTAKDRRRALYGY